MGKLALELRCQDELEEFLLEYETLPLRLEQNEISPELWDAVLTAVKNQLEKYFHGTLSLSEDYPVSRLLEFAKNTVMSHRMEANRRAMLGEPLASEMGEFTGAVCERVRRPNSRRRRRGRGSRSSAKRAQAPGIGIDLCS